MSKYQQFIFESYQFTPSNKTLELRYSLDDTVQFVELYRFDFEYVNYDRRVLDRALQLVFFMAGVSYYKTYLPAEIVVKQGELDKETASFFSKTWQRGLGEFFYVNQLHPETSVTFPTTVTASQARALPAFQTSGQLIGIGGGKDSLVSVELLRNQLPEILTWSANHRPQLTPLIERIGLPHAWVEREWDLKLSELKHEGAMNGHIPISAIFACVGTVVAILSGKRDIIVSNEQSANEPTLHYHDVPINHQYSKSQEFEKDFQALLKWHFGDSLRYYSSLRPFTELYIGELFANQTFVKYHDVFSSCNRAYVHSSDHMSWCGECPKCAFVFLILTPFIARSELELLWGGKNLLLDPDLTATYRQLLGIEGDKPLECVGEVKESRAAMRLCFEQYPDLIEKYVFELPAGYDHRQIASDEMPPEIRQLLMDAIAVQ